MVVLVDPLPLARRGLRSLLADCGALCTIEEACDGAKALTLMRRHGEGIALVCHRPLRLDALSLLRTLRAEGNGFRVAIIGSDLGPRRTLDALRLDVDGLLPEDVTATQLTDCVAALWAHARWLAVEVLREVVECEEATVAPLLPGLGALTPRQREIATLVADGLSNKAIARSLGIAEGTVKLQLHRIYRRTGHRNRTLLTAAVTLPNAATGTAVPHASAMHDPQHAV